MTIVYPHRIRLRGPWQCEPLSRHDGGVLPAPQRVTMPGRWRDQGFETFAGRVRLARHFGYPGRIDADERVWLTFAGIAGAAAVWLNGEALGGQAADAGPLEFEVTGLLRERNHLRVEVEDATGAGGLWGEVALEVRRTAFLRRVRCWIQGDPPRLHLTGELAGQAEGPLDLYVLLDRRTVLHNVVTVVEGASLDCASEPLTEPEPGPNARVELVQGAVVWYALEVAVGDAQTNP